MSSASVKNSGGKESKSCALGSKCSSKYSAVVGYPQYPLRKRISRNEQRGSNILRRYWESFD